MGETDKSDRADARAIRRAVQEPAMRFVAMTESQQDVLTLDCTRSRLSGNRTVLGN